MAETPLSPPPPRSRSSAEARATFRRTLVRVMVVQVVTLILLWLLQARYS